MSNCCRIRTPSHVKSLLSNLPLNSMCVLTPKTICYIVLTIPLTTDSRPAKLLSQLSVYSNPSFLSNHLGHLLNSIISPETIPLPPRRFPPQLNFPPPLPSLLQGDVPGFRGCEQAWHRCISGLFWSTFHQICQYRDGMAC